MKEGKERSERKRKKVVKKWRGEKARKRNIRELTRRKQVEGKRKRGRAGN